MPAYTPPPEAGIVIFVYLSLQQQTVNGGSTAGYASLMELGKLVVFRQCALQVTSCLIYIHYVLTLQVQIIIRG